jgi:hypothetical protein
MTSFLLFGHNVLGQVRRGCYQAIDEPVPGGYGLLAGFPLFFPEP